MLYYLHAAAGSICIVMYFMCERVTRKTIADFNTIVELDIIIMLWA